MTLPSPSSCPRPLLTPDSQPTTQAPCDTLCVLISPPPLTRSVYTLSSIVCICCLLFRIFVSTLCLPASRLFPCIFPKLRICVSIHPSLFRPYPSPHPLFATLCPCTVVFRRCPVYAHLCPNVTLLPSALSSSLLYICLLTHHILCPIFYVSFPSSIPLISWISRSISSLNLFPLTPLSRYFSSSLSSSSDCPSSAPPFR